ncbi:MAG: hypothetical protein CMJ83_01330 [Planctomycetes bacterium]|nr:hypothetical protein [Planctomycetota bacterium]
MAFGREVGQPERASRPIRPLGEVSQHGIAAEEGGGIGSRGVIRSFAQALPEFVLAGAFLYAWGGAAAGLPGATGFADGFQWWIPCEAFAVVVSALLIWFGTRLGRRFRGGAFLILILLTFILLPTTPLLASITGSAWSTVGAFVLLLLKFFHFVKRADRTTAAIATAWVTGYAALLAATVGILALAGVAGDALLLGAVYFAGLGATEALVHAVIRTPPTPAAAPTDLVPIPVLRWRALGYAWGPALMAAFLVCVHLDVLVGGLRGYFLDWVRGEFMAAVTCGVVVWIVTERDHRQPWIPWFVGGVIFMICTGAHVWWAWELESVLPSLIGFFVLFSVKAAGIAASPGHPELERRPLAAALGVASPLLIGLVWTGQLFIEVVVGPQGLDVAGPEQMPIIFGITFYGLLAVIAFLIGCAALNVPLEDRVCLACVEVKKTGSSACGVCMDPSDLLRLSPAQVLEAFRQVEVLDPETADEVLAGHSDSLPVEPVEAPVSTRLR